MTHYTPNAPWSVYPGECRTCYAWVRDNETMTDGDCMSCAEEKREPEDDDFDREAFDLKVRAMWEMG